jgi:hypothetical protein
MADIRKLDRNFLLGQALDAIKRYGLGADIRSDETINASGQGLLDLGKGAYTQTYVYDCHRKLSAPMAGALITQLSQLATHVAHPVLLVADYIAPRLGELLRVAGQEYIDTVGNAWLNSGPLLILCSGNAPAPKGSISSIIAKHDITGLLDQSTDLSAAEMASRYRASPLPRTITAAGIKVLFALISEPSLAQATYRELAAAAGVSLGALTQTLNDLQEHGYLSITGRTRHLLASRRLLDDWALMYARTLRPKYLLRTLSTADTSKWQTWALAKDAALWGGEPAAHLRVGFLRPGVLTIYAPKLPSRLIIDQGLKTATPGATDGLVEIRQIFWGAALLDGRPAQAVPATLIYADLLATGDARCIETAQKLYEQELAGLFPSA